MTTKEWLKAHKKGGVIGFMLWLLLLLAGFLVAIMIQDMLGGLILTFIVFPTTPITFILLGLYFGHKETPATVLVTLYVMLIIGLFVGGSYIFYKDNFTRQRTEYFNIDSDIQKNLDGCYKQFPRELRGKFGYLQCEYDVVYIVGNSKDARKKGLVGQKTNYDCLCAHSKAFPFLKD
ncbi:MAG: hypothetical protein WA057_00695 [Candidatus Magasanikiibacteriota bacterium]